MQYTTQGKGEPSVKAQRLVEYMSSCSSETYWAFVQALEDTNQGHLVKILRKAQDDAQSGSDFDGEYQSIFMALFLNTSLFSFNCGIYIPQKKILHHYCFIDNYPQILQTAMKITYVY